MILFIAGRPSVMAAPPPRGGLSLYDNLTDPNDPASSAATISSAPVLYNQDEAHAADSAPKKPLDPALRFQPIRRPQVKQPNKAKTSFPKAIPKPAAAVPSPGAPAPNTGPVPPKSKLADWAAIEDDDWQYAAAAAANEKRQRGGRKKKKRRQDAQAETDWDELYDPARPTNIDEFLKSDEKVDEVREWKALLYRHRRKMDDSDLSDDEDARPPPPSKFEPSRNAENHINASAQINSGPHRPSMPLRHHLHPLRILHLMTILAKTPMPAA